MNLSEVPPICQAVQPIHEVSCMLPEGHTEPHDSMVGIRWAAGPTERRGRR